MTELHVHHFGDPSGEPLLAVHGITGHGRRFRRSGEEGWPDRHTVAVDLRGHGRSTGDGPWSIAQHVTDLLDTMDAHGLASVDVLGHSYGGAIAMALLARAPERVQRLVLLDPALHTSAENGTANALAAIAFPGFASPEEAMQARLMGNDAIRDAVQEDLDEHLVRGDDGRWRYRVHPPAIIAGWGELCSPVPRLPVAPPTLVVAAARAPFVTPEIEGDLRAQLGDQLTLVRLDCGHMVYWEDFPGTVAAVTGFLSRPS
ncbi:MAG: alpha/beta hydrolase [Acidimicrobiales bacterium]|nr:alpha/beta hydrolase [Acidimicrobiales bacterium]MCB9393873.1 alpha/beta hydrolase [Acidimicrobiaceae bacterium]